MKKILITGVDSYIGSSFDKWVHQWPEQYMIDTVDMKDVKWKDKNFSDYDVVFHVAGLAHADVHKVTEEQKATYYKVNYTLAVETAQKAKAERVKQFIFMSTMIIYGESAGLNQNKIITKDTNPQPANFYGDSKWQADKSIRDLESDNFKIVVLRPPMIYGKGSKGNYPTLVKLAKKLPIFPDIDNERSMLHIDNLCEFVKIIIDNEERGIFFPQNSEYVKTSNIVKFIAEAHGKRIKVTKILNPIIKLASKIPGKIGGLTNKAFGNSVYEQSLSEYIGGEYRVRDLKESIKVTES